MRGAGFWITIGLLASAPAAAETLRCGARIVSAGASAAEVLGACGEPDFRDRWWLPHPGGPGFIAESEEWTYNFGSSQLLRVLRLRNGRLVDIGSDGYGFDAGAAPGCHGSEIVRGMSKYRLLAQCGEPMTREALTVLRPDDVRAREPARHVSVHREKWAYNFGESELLRLVTLENGRVTNVATGARGFDGR